MNATQRYHLARAFPAGSYGDETDYLVMQRCIKLRQSCRDGSWHHNVELATRGLSSDDAMEVYYARYHRREAEFE